MDEGRGEGSVDRVGRCPPRCPSARFHKSVYEFVAEQALVPSVWFRGLADYRQQVLVGPPWCGQSLRTREGIDES